MTDTFKPRQRVEVRRLIGADFTPDWFARATILRKAEGLDGYWAVKFDHGGRLCVHASQLRGR